MYAMLYDILKSYNIKTNVIWYNSSWYNFLGVSINGVNAIRGTNVYPKAKTPNGIVPHQYVEKNVKLYCALFNCN